MSEDIVVVMRKRDILKQIEDGIPDDAFIILPAWGLNGQMSGKATKGHKHEPMWGVRMFLSSDILVEPEFIGAIRSLYFVPITWLSAENAKRYINQYGFDLADKKETLVQSTRMDRTRKTGITC
jgi:hypothetical protein